MKIAVTGKGGVGKTTIAAVLARLYAEEGQRVIAADADPDANLGLALGFPEKLLDEIVPITTLRKLIEERTGANEENAILRRIINNLVLHRKDVAILDMEAGLEHFGRATTQGVDQFIVVIEPGSRSIQTYRNVKRLAKDLGVAKVGVIANKVRNAEDERFILDNIPGEEFLGFVHYNTEVVDADRNSVSPYDFSRTVTEEIRKIKERIEG